MSKLTGPLSPRRDGGAVNYEPNSFGGPVEDPRFREPPLKVSGAADRYDHREGNDDYTQPGNLFLLMTAKQKPALFADTSAAMVGVPQGIQRRWISHYTKADPAYGEGVARALGLVLRHAAE